MSTFRTKVGAVLAKPAFGKIREMLDPSEIGAAPLLGIDAPVFVGHGRSDSRAMVNAIKAAKLAIDHRLLENLRHAIQTSIHQE
jgi:glycerol-3-phosphate acyltransferase PlsX